MALFKRLQCSMRACPPMAGTSSTLVKHNHTNSYKLLIVGGGTGGCSIAAKYSRKLPKGAVAVIEPNDTHYYQPMFTLIGAGLKRFNQSHRREADVLPTQCTWIKDQVVTFNPDASTITTAKNETIRYEYLVVAMGIQMNFDQVPGLSEALTNDPRVCSNYSPDFVERTFPAIQSFKSGNAIFTFPNTPIKCAGAPQKIMYLADHHWRQTGVRDNANVLFNSALGAIFTAPKYAKSLLKVVEDRKIQLNFKHNLIEVRPESSEAVFAKLDSSEGDSETFKYDFLHVTPPMSPPDALKASPLGDSAGWLSVNKDTLQHERFPNIFGIGDCTNVPTSKTAAAIAGQNGVLMQNLDAVMANITPSAQYNGYTSCPLLVGDKKCIMAEFDYSLQPLETFPVDQGIPRRIMYIFKKDLMPPIYWTLFLNGRWNGPGTLRKILRLGL